MEQITRRQAMTGLAAGVAGTAVVAQASVTRDAGEEARTRMSMEKKLWKEQMQLGVQEHAAGPYYKVVFNRMETFSLKLPSGDLCLSINLRQHADDEPYCPGQRFLSIVSNGETEGSGSTYSLDGEHGAVGRQAAMAQLEYWLDRLQAVNVRGECTRSLLSAYWYVNRLVSSV